MAKPRKGNARSARTPASPPPKVKQLPKPRKPKIRPAAIKRPLVLHEQVANSYDLFNEVHREISKVFDGIPTVYQSTFDSLRRRVSVQLAMLREVINVADELVSDDAGSTDENGGAA